MAFNCTDINGLAISQFIFNEDGTVTGVVSTGSTASDPNEDQFGTTYKGQDGQQLKTSVRGVDGLSTSMVSQTCCASLNFFWDEDTSKCYWTQTCETASPDFKITLGAKGNEGAIFQVDEGETCVLEVKFDYLFQFNCEDITNCMSGGNLAEDLLIDAQNAISQKEEECADLQNLIDSTTTQLTNVKLNCDEQIKQIRGQIATKQEECAIIQKNIDNLKALLSDTTKLTFEQVQIYQNQLTVLEAQATQCNKELRDLSEQLLLVQSDCDNQVAKLDDTLINYQNLAEQCADELAQLQQGLTELTNAGEDTIVSCLSIFNNLDVSVVLDKVTQQQSPEEVDGNFENINALETVYEEQLFKIDNIVDYFLGNCNTGLLLTGNTACKTQVEQCLISELGDNCFVVSACTLDSDWLQHEFTISDEATLSAITNEKIKLGFTVNNCECDFSILVDRIEMNKSCTRIEREDIFVSRCPGFEIERVCDNKKSWVAEEEPQKREQDLSNRETDYTINDARLALNTKEVDLDISPANAIETDVWCYMRDNEDILACSTGTTASTYDCTTCITGSCGDVNLNINELLTTEVSAITTVKEFENTLCSELIDAKSRKTISAYPTLRALYDRYVNGFQGLPTSSKFDYFKMDNFTKLVGDYWVDLIEQVIPSTTLWGSTIKYRNTIFDKDKFKYKKYTLFTCTTGHTIEYPSPTSGSQETVEVITRDLSIPEYVGPDCLAPSGESTVCNGVLLKQINAGSEFIGTVSILGGGINPPVAIGEEVIAVTECDLSVTDMTFKFGPSGGTVRPTVLGGTGPFTYVWGIQSADEGYANWSITEVDQTTGLVTLVNNGEGSPTQIDNICLTVTVTDSNGCESTLTRCLYSEATF